jgi:subtilisin family serine protease
VRRPPLPPELGETTGGVGAGGTYVYVKQELLVGNEDLTAVLDLLEELFHDRVPKRGVEPIRLQGLEVTRLRLPGSAPTVPEIMDVLRDHSRGESLAVGPNIAVVWTSHPGLIPAGPPVPVSADEGEDDQLEQALAGAAPAGTAGQVLVGVLDTGVADHPWLRSRCASRGTVDLDDPDRDGDGKLDCGAGHGTFIAGVILQYAPQATVTVRRLQTSTASSPRDLGYATDAELAVGLCDWSTAPDFQQLRVLNLSIGGYTYDGAGLLATGRALQQCRQANPDLVVVAGAGNDDTSRPFFPAAYKDVVAVAAITDDPADQRACFSNQGWWVDACAPGVGLVSTFPEWPTGPMADHPPPSPACQGIVPESPRNDVEFHLVAEWRGTSFAAPIVAAWVAQRIATGNVTGLQAVIDLKGTVGAPGTLPGLGPWLPGLGRVVRPLF